MGELGAGVTLFLILLAALLLICWIILPFAVIGTKPLLRELIATQAETNRLLYAQARGVTPEPAPTPRDPHAPSPPPPRG